MQDGPENPNFQEIFYLRIQPDEYLYGEKFEISISRLDGRIPDFVLLECFTIQMNPDTLAFMENVGDEFLRLFQRNDRIFASNACLRISLWNWSICTKTRFVRLFRVHFVPLLQHFQRLELVGDHVVQETRLDPSFLNDLHCGGIHEVLLHLQCDHSMFSEMRLHFGESFKQRHVELLRSGLGLTISDTDIVRWLQQNGGKNDTSEKRRPRLLQITAPTIQRDPIFIYGYRAGTQEERLYKQKIQGIHADCFDNFRRLLMRLKTEFQFATVPAPYKLEFWHSACCWPTNPPPNGYISGEQLKPQKIREFVLHNHQTGELLSLSNGTLEKQMFGYEYKVVLFREEGGGKN